MSSYHIRGAVPLSSSAYVPRAFERAVLESTFADRWVVVLGPRQHGKSTSLIRILQELRVAGYLCAKIDLQSKPLCHNYDQFLAWFAFEIADGLQTDVKNAPMGIHSTSIQHWLSSIAPSGNQPIVIIVDEASAVGDTQWLENFYGQLRSIANRRAESSPGELAHRLLFVFSGTFLPEYLIINTQNSPFNVCERVYTDDLGLYESYALQKQVEGFVQKTLIDRIYGLVGGQPYLLQVILNTLHEIEHDARIAVLDSVVTECLGEIDDHFVGIFKRLEYNLTLRHLVAQMVRDEEIDIDPADPDYRYLQVIGLASAEGSKLHFRNAIYRQVAHQNTRIRESELGVGETSGESNQVTEPNSPKRIVVLFLSADPSNASRLRLSAELREIQEKLQLATLRERFQLHQQMAARPADISQSLLDRQPQIVHFSGHGTATGALCFENEIGETHPIEPDALAALFEQFANHVKCVVLNACFSESQANAIAQYIDHVIGMKKAIGDEAAIAFSVGFYQALGAGRPVEEAYSLGCVQIRLHNIPEHLTPILVTRSSLRS